MNRLQRIIATGLITVPLLLGVSGCGESKNGSHNNTYKTEQVQEDNQLRNTVLSYLSQPKFSNSDFMEQITGTKAKLQIFDLREGMVYLSIPKQYFTKEVLRKLTINPDLVEFGKTPSGELNGSRIILGNYVLRKPGSYFF